MSQILLFGEAPLPFSDCQKRPSGGLRTWQFLQPLQNSGHKVNSILFTRPDFWLKSEIPVSTPDTILIDREDPEWKVRAQNLLKKLNPDCVIAVGSLPSERASLLKFTQPFWADLNGSPLMEGATQAMRLDSDALLPHFWAREKLILETADVFSTCSRAQSQATFGMLGILGRLNHLTFNHPFLHPLPNLTEISDIDLLPPDSEPLFRDRQIPKNAIIVSMIGGWWNSWLDEQTLFQALEIAMADQSHLHFVAGGGTIPGLTLAPLDNFQKLVAGSKFKDRFHFLGWIPASDLTKAHHEADMVISVDRICPDTQTGARNRLTEWAKFGLPIVTTKGTEVANQLVKNQAAVGVEIGNAKALADALIWLSKDKILREQLGQKAKQFCETNWNFSKMQPLLDWVNHPILAPDHAHSVSLAPSFWNSKVKPGLKYCQENGWHQGLKKIKQHLKSK